MFVLFTLSWVVCRLMYLPLGVIRSILYEAYPLVRGGGGGRERGGVSYFHPSHVCVLRPGRVSSSFASFPIFI